MKQKEKEFIKWLIGSNVEVILSANSSLYAEADEQGFLDNYGVTMEEAYEAVKKWLDRGIVN